jgi:hypothetical protein
MKTVCNEKTLSPASCEKSMLLHHAMLLPKNAHPAFIDIVFAVIMILMSRSGRGLWKRDARLCVFLPRNCKRRKQWMALP